MRKAILGLSCFMMIISSLRSQVVVQGIVPGNNPKPAHFHPCVNFGLYIPYAVINNRLEVRGSYKPGISLMTGFQRHRWFMWTAEYSRYFTHTASPSFDNIKAWNAEMNGIFLMNVGESYVIFRAIFGASLLDWNGRFIGPTLNDNNKWSIGMNIHQSWIAANLGCGFEYNICHGLIASADYRARFASKNGDLISISDTAYFIGLRYRFGNNENDADSGSGARRKSSTSKPGRIYKWLRHRPSA
ncbi:MAG TPA: hypothetical protein VFU15_09235 [Bacteroidia bacterium]|nr:hypothetical protein [Bacteroidia bacterium]